MTTIGAVGTPGFRGQPSWRTDRDRVRVTAGAAGARVPPWAEGLLAGIADGATLEALDATVMAARPERREARARLDARSVLYALYRAGVIDLPMTAPPKVVVGRFTLADELGRGGVGVAWRALDADHGDRPVVLKHAWDLFAPLAALGARIEEEAQLLAAFDHPNIARGFGVHTEAGTPFVARSFVAGRDLEAVAEGGLRDEAARGAFLRGMAAALGHLHARGFTLVSVRPQNFMVPSGTRDVVLFDVGHARPLVDGVAKLKSRAGSPGFVAPEVAATKTATARTDVWGFGRAAWSIATGRVPSAKLDAAAFTAGLAEAGVPAAEAALLARCAAPEPAARPASFSEVLEALA